MALYQCTFSYDGEDYTFETDVNYNELWEFAEVGATEVFDDAGVDWPEDFDYDLFESPSCVMIQSDDDE